MEVHQHDGIYPCQATQYPGYLNCMNVDQFFRNIISNSGKLHNNAMVDGQTERKETKHVCVFNWQAVAKLHLKLKALSVYPQTNTTNTTH